MQSLRNTVKLFFSLLGYLALYAASASAQIFPSPPMPVNYYALNDTINDGTPSIATDNEGNWLVAWVSDRKDCGYTPGPETDIFVSRSTDHGLTWGQTRILDASDRYGGAISDQTPSIKSLGSGRWALVWRGPEGYSDGSYLVLMSKSEDNGKTWSTPESLGSSIGDGSPQIASDRAGRLYSTRYQTVSKACRIIILNLPYTVYYSNISRFGSLSLDGGDSWSSTKDFGFSEDSSLQTDGMGNWYSMGTGTVVSCDFNNADVRLQKGVINGDSLSWSNLNSPDISSGYKKINPNLAVDGKGALVASWIRYDPEPNPTYYGPFVRKYADFGTTRRIIQNVDGQHNIDPSSKPAIVGDGRGNWVIVWVASSEVASDELPNDTELLYAISTDDAETWSPSALLNTWESSYVDSIDSHPSVATDGLGHWVVTWTTYFNFRCDASYDSDIASTTFTLGEVIEEKETEGSVDFSTECEQFLTESDAQGELRPSAFLNSPTPMVVDGAIPVTITMSRLVGNLAPPSLTLKNATVSDFTGNQNMFSGTEYTFLLHPIVEGYFSVKIDDGMFSDAEFQQPNLPSNVLSRTYVQTEDWHTGIDGELKWLPTSQKITLPAKSVARFGRSVAVSSDILLAGNDKASAPHFKFDGQSWIHTGEIMGDWLIWEPQSGFSGFDVDVLYQATPSGVPNPNKLTIVGAPYARHFDPSINEPDGMAILSDYNARSDKWKNYDVIAHADTTSGKETGYSVAVGFYSGFQNVRGYTYYAVGMPNLGSVYVKHANSSYLNILPSPDAFPGDRFGCSVAAWDQNIVVGADASGAESELAEGSAYVIRGGTNSFPEFTCPSYAFKLSVPGLQRADLFGADVAIHEGTILVGAPGESYGAGAVYVFSMLGDQVDWSLTKRLTPPDGVAGDAFGTSVSFFGDTAVIGAPGQDEVAVDAGAAYVFRTVEERWELVDKLLAPDADAGDGFGAAVDNGVANMVVGAPGDDETGLDAGAVYAYRGGRINHIPQGAATDETKPVPTLSCVAEEVVNAPVRVTLRLDEFMDSIVPLILATENATFSEVSSFNGAEFSFLLTPRAPGAFSVSVPADRFTDAAGNLNLASNVVTRVYEVSTDGEGAIEGEAPDGAVDGEVIVEGTPEGLPEGLPEGTVDGVVEGAAEGVEEGAVEGVAEGTLEGGGESEGEGEGLSEGAREGTQEGEGEGEITAARHSLDTNANNQVDLNELLRVIQLYNGGAFGCALDTEDGFAPDGANILCTAHSGDYNPQDWKISLSELLRIVQLYNVEGFEPCPESEDGFCPVQ